MRVPDGEVEIVAAWLLDRFPAGLEQRDLDASAELAVYTDEAGAATVREAFPGAVCATVVSGWEDAWKEFHRPVSAGGLWIGPPWIERPADANAVVLDPGRAFGTGAHATTRACIEVLSTLERGSLLDAGCGSGVLAVAAARLGFAPVLAVDVDEVAVAVAIQTAAENDAAVGVSCCDVLRDELPAVDVVVANIERGVVECLLERVSARVAVTSGYLAAETPSARRWSCVDRLELEGWVADVFVEPH